MSSSLADVPTPALLIDADQVLVNARRMLDTARARGLSLRPNIKTHKSVALAWTQCTGLALPVGRPIERGGDALRVVSSTLLESEHFLAAGFDVLYAVPLAGAAKLARARELHERFPNRFAIMLDSEEAVGALQPCAHPWRVWLAVDPGYGREGRIPTILQQVASALEARAGVATVAGYYCHAGHSYRIGDEQMPLDQQAACECAAMKGWTAGTPISVGSTPTAARAAQPDAYAHVTELHPGNYVLYDRMQVQIGSCSLSDVAVSVLGTVVGVYPERGSALIDVGSRALGKDTLEKPDPSPWAAVVGHPDVHLVTITQEVGILCGSGVAELRLGQQLRLLPNHSCLTCTNFSTYHVVSKDGAVLGTIDACPRGFC